MVGRYRVEFSTPLISNVSWIEGLEDLSDTDIEELISECDMALASLLYQRRARRGQQPSQPLLKCRRLFQEGFEKHMTGQRGEKLQRDSLVASSANQQQRQSITEFLRLVSRKVDPVYEKIISQRMGLRNIVNLDKPHRAKFIQDLVLHRNETQLPDHQTPAPIETVSREPLVESAVSFHTESIQLEYYNRAWQSLRSEAQDLARLLCHLEHTIPEKLLKRAFFSRPTWNSDGEVEGVWSESILCTRISEDWLECLLALLHEQHVIRRSADTLEVDPGWRGYLRDQCHHPATWKVKTFQLVIWAFPTDQMTDPLDYAVIGRLQLPHLRTVLEFLDTPDFVGHLSLPAVEQTARACLSASRFSDPPWKRHALTIAERIVQCRPTDAQLALLLALRKQSVFTPLPTCKHISAPINNTSVHNWQLCFGEMILVNAQDFIEHNDLNRALRELEKFDQFPSKPSTRSGKLLQRMNFCRAKIIRFQGNFLDARTRLDDSNSDQLLYSGLRTRVVCHFIGVTAETGDTDAAEKHIEATERTASMGRNFQIVKNEVHIMKMLRSLRSSNCLGGSKKETEYLQAARCGLKELRDYYQQKEELGKLDIFNFLRVQAGLAIISHLTDQVDVALSDWALVARFAQKYWGDDFVAMISHYSMSELALRAGYHEKSAILFKQAETVFGKCGRQFYVICLGSIWFDAIGEWRVQNGGNSLNDYRRPEFLEST